MKNDLLWKRVVSVLLAAALIVCGCSVMAFAEEEETPKLSPEELQEAVNQALQAEETVEKFNEMQRLLEEALQGSVLPSAGSSEVYTLEQALALVGTEEGRQNNGMLELSDDFSDLDPLTDEVFFSEGGKIIILWRESSVKKYEVSYSDFSEDFNGTDEGAPRVFLCAELMERIPEELRATTPDEADNIIMAETFYLHTGTLTSGWNDDSVEEPPTEEEIRRMFSEEESGEAADTVDEEEEIILQYVPFFTCVQTVGLYDAETGGFSFLYAETYDHEELRRAPDAADQWENMVQLLMLIDVPAASRDEVLKRASMQAIYDAGDYSFLEESAGEQLATAVENGDVDGAVSVCEATFWDMAETLKTLDPDAVEGYDTAIEMKSYEAIQYIAESRNYTSVDKSLDRIEADKSYTGKPDLQVLNDTLLDVVDLMENELEWDMFYASLFAALG